MTTVSIPLTQGKVAIIDEADLPLVSQHKWYAARNGDVWYAMTHIWRDGKRTAIQMHRLLMGDPLGVLVDHENRNGLDNRRLNLREATRADNKRNSRLPKNSTSGFKGVYWKRSHQAWQVQIRVDNKTRHVGYFKDKEAAAHAYDNAAREAFGAFARCNFPR